MVYGMGRLQSKNDIKLENFYYRNGEYCRSIAYKGGYSCPVCGREIKVVKRIGGFYTVNCNRLLLIEPGCFGADKIITTKGRIVHGKLVRYPEKGKQNYVVGYSLHNCDEVSDDE